MMIHQAPPGSPPRVRGKVLYKDARCDMTRITPACAGKSKTNTRAAPCLRDHPRVCGEKSARCRTCASARGSPPRVRGKGILRRLDDARCRITPACAGKSTLRKTAGSTYRDHPRVCGEKAAERAEVGKGRGSPPRVRGKVIPPLVVSPLTGDHPRVCGEKPTATAPRARLRGSPPRVRGKVQVTSLVERGLGITPACAGKRQCSTSKIWGSWDHPRVCGEKTVYDFAYTEKGGSPPRVRGKVDRGVAPVRPFGITPACAGKRLKKALKNKDF